MTWEAWGFAGLFAVFFGMWLRAVVTVFNLNEALHQTATILKTVRQVNRRLEKVAAYWRERSEDAQLGDAT